MNRPTGTLSLRFPSDSPRPRVSLAECIRSTAFRPNRLQHILDTKADERAASAYVKREWPLRRA